MKRTILALVLIIATASTAKADSLGEVMHGYRVFADDQKVVGTFENYGNDAFMLCSQSDKYAPQRFGAYATVSQSLELGFGLQKTSNYSTFCTALQRTVQKLKTPDDFRKLLIVLAEPQAEKRNISNGDKPEDKAIWEAISVGDMIYRYNRPTETGLHGFTDALTLELVTDEYDAPNYRKTARFKTLMKGLFTNRPSLCLQAIEKVGKKELEEVKNKVQSIVDSQR